MCSTRPRSPDKKSKNSKSSISPKKVHIKEEPIDPTKLLFDSLRDENIPDWVTLKTFRNIDAIYRNCIYELLLSFCRYISRENVKIQIPMEERIRFSEYIMSIGSLTIFEEFCQKPFTGGTGAFSDYITKTYEFTIDAKFRSKAPYIEWVQLKMDWFKGKYCRPIRVSADSFNLSGVPKLDRANSY